MDNYNFSQMVNDCDYLLENFDIVTNTKQNIDRMRLRKYKIKAKLVNAALKRAAKNVDLSISRKNEINSALAKLDLLIDANYVSGAEFKKAFKEFRDSNRDAYTKYFSKPLALMFTKIIGLIGALLIAGYTGYTQGVKSQHDTIEGLVETIGRKNSADMKPQEYQAIIDLANNTKQTFDIQERFKTLAGN